MKHILPVTIALIICFAVAACDNESAKARALATTTAETFHRQFNDPRNRDLLIVHAESGHPEFVAYLNSAYVRDARARLGLFQSASVKSIKTDHRPAGIGVDLTLNSQFERGTATEKISFLVAGSSAVLDGYSIESPLLRAPQDVPQ